MEAVRQLGAFIAAILGWLKDHQFYIYAFASATAAAVLTARVMRWLDEGLVRGLGIWFTGLAALFVLTIVTVRAAVAGTAAEPHAPYGVALLVLFVALVIWGWARRVQLVAWMLATLASVVRLRSGGVNREAPSLQAQPPPPLRPTHWSSAFLVLIASAALITVLWIIDASIDLNESAGGQRLSSLPVSSADFLAQAAAAGLLAMATIQGVRTIVPIRGAFHRAALIRWIDESVKSAGTAPKGQTSTPTAKEVPEPSRPAPDGTMASPPVTSEATAPDTKTETPAEDTPAPPDDPTALLMEIAQMASPASGAHHYALFDLPIEQLCGQIAAGADRLLDNVVPAVPEAVPQARTTITIGDAMKKAPAAAEQSDAAKELDTAARQAATNARSLLRVLSASRKDVDQFLGFAGAPAARQPPEGNVLGNVDTPISQEMKQSRDRLRLRAAISQRIQQNIDRLQIDATFWWRRLLRGVAVTICGVLGLTLLDGRTSAVVFAIVGGFVATVARDLVAIIEKSRR